MEIKAADVAKLRQMTGAGMMDCKKALVEAEGDYVGHHLHTATLEQCVDR